MALNEQQQQVARAERSFALKVIAGAGTGKTETLAARFVQLVRDGAQPSEILLLTFTDEAAAEMRNRVMLRLREVEPALPPHAMIDLWCHTFHGFAMRLLREYGWALGLPPTPRLLDEVEQQALLDEIVAAWEEDAGDGDYRPLEHERYRWDNGEAWERARHVLRSLRSSGATTADLAAHPQLREQQERLFGAERAQLVPLVEHAFAAYGSQLRETGSLDYDEQIVAACRLLEKMPELRDRFVVVMVDEFQDTNPAQLNLLALLRPEWSSMTVVGDPRQAIYGWRSARPDSLREFPYGKDRPLVDEPLQRNYRSRQAIIEIANLSLAQSDLAGEAPLEAALERPPAQLELVDEPVVSLHVLQTVEQEASLVAAEIRRLVDAGIAAQDIALLLRARTRLDFFTKALESVGVVYRISGGTGFFRQPAVRLVASLLRLLHAPEDRAAAAHVLESPLLGFDPYLLQWREPEGEVSAADSFHRWLLEPDTVPLGLPDREAVAERLRAFAVFAQNAEARSLVLSPSDFLSWLVDASGLKRWWDEQHDRQALRDFGKLVALADTWRAAVPGLTVAGYRERLAQRVAERTKEAVPVEQAVNAVEIATVHGAKGREWPVVFVADTRLPATRSGHIEHVLWDERWKLVISDGRTSSKSGADPLADLRRDMRRRARNEERAIWYVALTRARDRLIVTHSGCPVDEQGHFADGRQAEDGTHFFHQLWELVRSEHEGLAETVVWDAPGAPVQPISGERSTRE